MYNMLLAYSYYFIVDIEYKYIAIIYIIKQDIRIYMYYVLPAGPIGLKFFVDTHGWWGML